MKRKNICTQLCKIGEMMKKETKQEILRFALPMIIIVGIYSALCIPWYFDLQEFQLSMEVLCIYNDDPLLSISDVSYREELYQVERGFPDFWNIKTVISYVSAEYPDGDVKFYTVYTDVETMKYEIE